MDNVYSLIGLMFKAHKLLLGEAVLERIKEVKYLIIASDISVKSKERYLKKCHYYEIDYYDKIDADNLSRAIGKNNVKVVGITDEGFRELFIKKVN